MRHRRRARRKSQARSEAIRTVRRTLNGAKGLNAASTSIVFNVGLYLLLLDQDLAHFTDDLVNAIDGGRRTFVAKLLATLLYEAAEDCPQLLGKTFRTAVSELGASADQMSKLNSVSSELNRFWQSHREFLGEIRNVLAAHREHDALLYAESLDSLKPLEIMARSAELTQLLEALINVITDLGSLTNSPAKLVRDMRNSRGR
jgi:hypothetical protein